MDQTPPPQLITTFIVAVTLKLIGVSVAMIMSAILIQDWGWDRWWMAFTTSIILLLLLAPWRYLRPQPSPKMTHKQLIIALAFAICAPQIDLIQSTWVPLNPSYLERLVWYAEQVHDIHALGALFTMVPVVLASWQYGRFGMYGSLGLAGLLYVLTPMFLPPHIFTWILYGVRGFVMLGVTLILAFTVEALASAQRREQAALQVANQQLAQANHQLAEQAAVMEQLATSRERNRLARELHDTLAHSLSATAVQLQAVHTLLKVNPTAAATELQTAQQQIRDGLKESRRAIAALRSSLLEELGLAEALCQRAFNLGERSGLSVQCQVNDLPPNLSPLTEQTIYRIADESLLNAEKHAQASEITLSLNRHGSELRLIVTDNGVGFDTSQAQTNGHFGVMGMQERAHLIGATLTIISHPHQGTQVQLVVQLEPTTPLMETV